MVVAIEWLARTGLEPRLEAQRHDLQVRLQWQSGLASGAGPPVPAFLRELISGAEIGPGGRSSKANALFQEVEESE